MKKQDVTFELGRMYFHEKYGVGAVLEIVQRPNGFSGDLVRMLTLGGIVEFILGSVLADEWTQG
jgi:hypothetical protein